MASQRSTIGAATGMRLGHGENTDPKHSANRPEENTCAAASTCVLPHTDVHPVNYEV